MGKPERLLQGIRGVSGGHRRRERRESRQTFPLYLGGQVCCRVWKSGGSGRRDAGGPRGRSRELRGLIERRLELRLQRDERRQGGRQTGEQPLPWTQVACAYRLARDLHV